MKIPELIARLYVNKFGNHVSLTDKSADVLAS